MDEIEKSLQDLKLAENQLKALKAAFKGLGGAELKAAVGMFKSMYKEGQGFEKSLNSAVKASKELDKSFSSTGDTVKDLYGQLRGITSEIKGQQKSIQKSRGAFRGLESAAQQLLQDEEGILDLNKQQVSTLVRKLKTNKAIVEQEAKRLRAGEGLSKKAHEELDALLHLITAEGDLGTLKGNTLDQALELIQAAEHLSNEQKAVLSSIVGQDNTLNSLLDKGQKRLDLERTINKNMGVTGALVQGTGALMERLGMRSGIFHQAMEDAGSTMREMAKDAGENAGFLERMKISATGLGIVLKGFGAALFDPFVYIAKIVDAFFELDKAAVQFQRLTGQNAKALAGMNSNLITSVEVLETMGTLTEDIGVNINGIMTTQQLGRLAEASKLLGLSSEQTVNLAKFSKISGDSITGYEDGLIESVNRFNGLNNSAVAHGQVMRDVLNVSQDIALSLGGNPEALGRAATAARKFGLSLEQVDNIAGQLMDFESSIQAELEAQLLTGGQINLSKARELALNNDIEGLSKEIADNNALSETFATSNRIQQESMAKALGMSRKELATMIGKQMMQKDISDEALKNATGMTRAQLEQITAQEKFNTLMNKLAQAAAPILDILHPIADILVDVLTPIGNVIAKITQTISELKTSFETISDSEGYKNLISVLQFAAGGALAIKFGKSLFNKFTKGKLGSKESNPMFVKIVDAANDLFGNVTDLFGGKKGGKGGIVGRLKDAILGKKFKGGQIMGKGMRAAAGGQRAGGLVGKLKNVAGSVTGTGKGAISAGAKGAKSLGTKSGGLIGNLTSKLTGGPGKMLTKLFQSPITKVFSKLLGPIMAAISGISNIRDVIGNAKIAQAAGETVDYGKVGKSIVQAGAYPIANLALNAIPAAGTILSVADGVLSTMGMSPIKWLTDNLINLIPDSAFSGLGEFAAKDKDTNIKATTPPPKMMATGGIVSQPTNAIVGEAGPEAVVPLREFYAKMDELINVVKQGGNIYMDGNKVGQSLVLASTRTS